MGAGMEWERDNSNYISGMESAGNKILEFIKSKQPKGMKCTCICGHEKWMIDRKELEDFIKDIELK